MSAPVAPRWRRWRIAVMAVAAVLAAGVLGSCATQPADPATSAPDPVPASGTLATSLETAQGSWAIVAMGHLDDPSNTFWQLLFEPVGTHSWSDQVRGTAVATNGGVVMAADADGTLLAGVRPSGLLTFSPLAGTADGGRSWTDDVLTSGLVDEPDVLATGPPGVLGLVAGPAGPQVVQSASIAGPWQSLGSARALAGGGSARRCRLESVTAVSYLQRLAVAAGQCRQPGVAGIFVHRPGGWQRVGPTAPELRGGQIEVVSLRAAGDTLVSLLGVRRIGGRELVAAWTTDGEHWTCSEPLALTAAEHLVSVGPATGTDMFALLDGGSGKRQLGVVGPGRGWQALPPPPTGSATVAFTSTGVDALTVDGATLTVWTLARTLGWTRGQSVDVPIQYGSSS